MPKKRLVLILALVAMFSALFVAQAWPLVWNATTQQWESGGIVLPGAASTESLCIRYQNADSSISGSIPCTCSPAGSCAGGNTGAGLYLCAIPGSQVANSTTQLTAYIDKVDGACSNVVVTVLSDIFADGTETGSGTPGTGPNAVTLAGFRAGSGSAPLFLLPLGIVLVGGIAFIARKRSLS